MGNKKKNSNYVTEKRMQAQAEKEQAKKLEKRKRLIKMIAIPTVAVVLLVSIILGLGAALGWFYQNPNKDLTVTHHATLKIKGYDETVHIELYGNDAPITVNNFVKLANEGFYNGLTFHRIIEDFMAQGGCPYGTGTGDSGTDIKGEFTENGVNNPVKHVRGTISMARGDDPNSGSSQFFIVHKTSENNTLSLDGKYAAFGMVIDGMDVIDSIIKSVTPGYNGSVTASEQPVIESISIHEAH